MIRALSVVLLVAAANGAVQKVNPVQKVISLLEKMQHEVQEEGRDEAASYDKFACFCKATADSKLNAIKRGHEHVELLEAKIEALETDISALASETADCREEIADVEKTMEEQAEQRASEFALFQSDDEDLAGAIDSLQRAVDKMTSSKSGMMGAKTLLFQKSAKTALKKFLSGSDQVAASPEELKTLYALLQEDSQKQPAAHAFEFQSNELIATLKKTLKFEKDKQYERQKEEEKTKHSFNMAQSSRANQVKVLTAKVNKNEEIQAGKEQEKSANEAEKGQTETDTTADQVFLDELTKACEQKAKDWDKRSEVRSNELTAMAEALGLLKQGVAGNYEANKKLVLATQKTSEPTKVMEELHDLDEDPYDDDDDDDEAVSFLQRKKKSSKKAQMKKHAIDYLKEKAKALKSPVLGALVMKIKEDHFKKVRDTIKDMVARLESEAEAEADQKSWCDDEMADATDKRDTQQARIESENARVTMDQAMIEKLSEEIADLGAQIADLYKALNEQTQLRAEDKDENTKTLADAKAGLDAVKGALKVLNDFYGGALIQTDTHKYEPFKAKGSGADGKTVSDMAPETFGGDYEGKQEKSKGIVGLLNVIVSDFERTIKTTEQAEKDNQAAYDEFKTDAESSIEEKKSSKKDKEGEKGETHADWIEAKDERKDAESLKADALHELEKLKPACVSTGSSYEEKVARRKQEIEALKEAVQILTDMR